MKIEVDQYQNIRHLYIAQGLSKREIARRLRISRNTVTKYCEGRQVPWEPASYSRFINGFPVFYKLLFTDLGIY